MFLLYYLIDFFLFLIFQGKVFYAWIDVSVLVVLILASLVLINGIRVVSL